MTSSIIYVENIISSKMGLLHSEGQMLYEQLKKKLHSNSSVTIDFTGIKTVTTGFCASSIGRLLTELDDTQNKSLVFIGVDGEMITEKIKNVIDLTKNDSVLTRYCDSLNSLFE